MAKANLHVLVWPVAFMAAFLLAAALTTPMTRIAKYSFVIFKSNIRSFSVTVLAAFLFFLMLAWFRLFLDTLVLVAACILTRIDFQTAGFSEEQTFWVISFLSWIGLGSGFLVYRLTSFTIFHLN
ncbi:hypothetical protein NUACC21_02160 [Scytonema sp. NUACC21]